jgi:UDP-N-acetyl-2-amino-2-deoxyglucuronate dehydrogenase
MKCQIEDFLKSIADNTEPFVTGEFGRKTVELFSAIYQSNYDNMPVKFPLNSTFNPKSGNRLPATGNRQPEY